MYIAFNIFFKEELMRSERSLLRPEIEFIIDKAERFDFNNKVIYCGSKKKYNYDF